MASGLCAVVVLALCVVLAPCVSAGDKHCKAYKDTFTNVYRPSQTCYGGSFCCGTCNNRFCCSSIFTELTEDAQDDCYYSPPSSWNPVPMIVGITISIVCVLVFICCCVCPCCCLYKICCKQRPVTNTTTTTHTVVTTIPQQYPRQQVATPPGQPAGYQYPSYQATPMQPGYGTQIVPQSYGVQPMPIVPYQGQPYTPGPPPTYQEATGPAYPPNPMPYSQAVFPPGQTSYPLQPPVHPQPNAPPSQTDYLTQPAYNPDYVGQQPKQ